MTRPRIDVAERRARLAVRHRLAQPCRATSLVEATRSMTVLHSTDAAGCFLQAWARIIETSPEAIEAELYDAPTVLRLLAMRRTLFLVPLEDIPIVHAAASRGVAEVERKRTAGMLEGAGIGEDAAAHLAELEEMGLAAVRERGDATTAELTRLDPRLAERITFARGKAYEGSISVSSKVFFHLALDGRIGRGRPRGTWISGQYRWSPIERWFPDGIPALPVDEARAELVRRWLRTFGPGTRDDIKWWTGWTVASTRQALDALGAIEVDMDGGEVGYVLPDDLGPTAAPEPWVALLPALDATTMGWASRNWYLGTYRAALFDTAGNAGPTIWVDGRIVGGWAQREDGEIALYLLEDVGTETQRMIDAEAARLADWLGPTRVRWSFPTPLDAELRS
jgi:hypothetical protein